jgi:putative oxidoreductase
MNRLLSRLPFAPNAAALVLRLTVGVVLLAHGLPKLRGGVSSFAGFVGTLNLPFPTVTAYLVVGIEVIGGALLIVGLLTRLWGLLAALMMVGTTLLVKLDGGLIAQEGGAGMELDLLILAAALAVTLIGPGSASADAVLGIDRPVVAAADASGRRTRPAPQRVA